MADSSRGSWGGRRVSSRVPSARSSVVIDDSAFLQPSGYPSGSHRLRVVDSRFSLNEQFALTRREFEFGFDDGASSIWERSTMASEAGIEEDENEDTVMIDTERSTTPVSRPIGTIVLPRNHYELFCLPKSPSLSPDEIRTAYRRLLQILAPERQPAYLQDAAALHLAAVQTAFETLIEPHRKLDYDLSTLEDKAGISEGLDQEEALDTLSGHAVTSASMRDQYFIWTQGQPHNTTDLALRTGAPWTDGNRPSNLRLLNPLDFVLRHSTTVALPAVGAAVDNASFLIFGPDGTRGGKGHGRICAGVPTVTVTGSAHALVAKRATMAPLFLEPYTPPGLLLQERRHLATLLAQRLLPGLQVKFRQEFFGQPPAEDASGCAVHASTPITVVEQEFAILPEAIATTRVAHAVQLPKGGNPVHVEVALRTPLDRTRAASGVGLALHRRIERGTVFATFDSGDWSQGLVKECQELSQFSRKLQGPFKKLEVLPTAPTVEAGYTWSSYDMGLLAGRAFTQTAERNVSVVDRDLETDKAGSWSASAAATAWNAAAYLRYGRNLLSLLSPSQSAVLPAGNPSHRWAGLRGEVELGATRHRDVWLALRALKRVGRFSRLGFEVSWTRSSVHLSLYWSRLGQRFSFPFLLASQSSLNAKVFFWATVVPFVTFAALEYFHWRPKPRKTRPPRNLQSDEKDVQAMMAQRAAEADDLTGILAAGVQVRQAMERQRGGLIIRSAKYGAKDAPSDEVADVTVALAALVDQGKLTIPQGLRKSRLLGFWDPSPLTAKVLRVQYLWQGREQSIEVSGGDELKLP